MFNPAQMGIFEESIGKIIISSQMLVCGMWPLHSPQAGMQLLKYLSFQRETISSYLFGSVVTQCGL